MPVKYSLPDLERRWRVRPEAVPTDARNARLIEDRYLDGSRLRLRRVTGPDGSVLHKLTKKYPATATDCHASTNLYLDAAEYALFVQLPGRPLRKRRHAREHAGMHFALDVFEGALRGLVLTEIECPEPAALAAVPPPPWAALEVTHVQEYTGGALSRLDAAGLARLLAQG